MLYGTNNYYYIASQDQHDIHLSVFVDIHDQVAASNQVGGLDNGRVSLIFYPPDNIIPLRWAHRHGCVQEG